MLLTVCNHPYTAVTRGGAQLHGRMSIQGLASGVCCAGQTCNAALAADQHPIAVSPSPSGAHLSCVIAIYPLDSLIRCSHAVCAALAVGVQAAAFGWEHAVILLASGCVVACPIPMPAVKSNTGGDPSASSQTLSIPEAAIAVAAGEQHRCGMSPRCNLDLTCAQLVSAVQRQVVSKRDHVLWPLQPCSNLHG